MSTLAELQRDFMAALFSDVPARDPGIAIYRRNVLANQHDALATTYPVVRRLVGEAFFRETARRYSRAHPSVSGDLHAYGGHIARFLETYSHARSLPYLPDVARLEWALHECFHAIDGATLDFEALAHVDPERHGDIRFTLHPAVRLVRSAHPVAAIWEANQPGGDGSPLGDGPEQVAVSRVEGEVRVTALAAREWDLLHALALGAALGDASAGFDAADGAELTAALSRLAGAGVIAGFVLRPLDA